MILRKLIRASIVQVKHELSWRQKDQYLQFLVYDAKFDGTTIYTVDSQITFPELKQRELFRQYQFVLPKEVDPNTPVSTILIEQQRPISIQVTHHGETYQFKNRSAQPDQKCMKKVLANSMGPFKVSSQEGNMGQYKRALTGFYLRLQAEAFFRQKGYSLKGQFTQPLKEELLSYLGEVNQVDNQSRIVEYLQASENAAIKIQNTQQKIDSIMNHADKLLNAYRFGAIGLSALHISAFTYMIFFVDWLGWDIIEPLTFSITTFYTLLAMRFYRKFNKDRSQDTIKQRLREWVLRPHNIVELRILQSKLAQQQNELRDVQQKLKLAKNRLILQTTLPQDL